MYRGSPSPSESPQFEAPDFPHFRRVKPLPKRRRTSAAVTGLGSMAGEGLLVSEENLSATVTAIFDEHQRQRQRLQAQGILPPSGPPSNPSPSHSKMNNSSAGTSLSQLSASIANAATDPKMSDQELEDILLAHADNLSTRMTMQNYYMPSLGGVRGFLSSATAAVSTSPSNELDNRKVEGPTPLQVKLPAPPPMSSFSELKDLDLSLDIDLDSIEEFGARFAAAAAAAGAAIDEFSLVQERFMHNGKGRPVGNSTGANTTGTNRPREKNRDRGGDEEDVKDEEELRLRQEGQGNTKKRKVPAEGVLRDRDRDREREKDSGEEEDDVGGADEQDHPDGDSTSNPSTPLRLNAHSHQEQPQFGGHHGSHSYAPVPYPGLLAHVRRRRGKLTAAALAGVQQKEMLRRRRRQLAAFVGGLAGSGEEEGVSYSWSGAGGFIAGGSIKKGNATEEVNEAERGGSRDDIGYGMSLAFEQALMQMRMGTSSGKSRDEVSNGDSASFGIWTSTAAVPSNANSTTPGKSGGIFSNATGIGIDMEVESQLLFESVTGLGLSGGIGGMAGSHTVQGGSITFDFGSVSSLGESLPSHLPPGILDALNTSLPSSNPTLPFPMSMQQPTPSVRKSKRRTVRLARAMKIMLEMPEKKSPHPDAVAFPKKDVFEFKWPSGTADRLSATKEEVLALRRRFETELDRQKKKTKRLALVAAAAASAGAGSAGSKQLPMPMNDKEKERDKVVGTRTKREREHNVPSNVSTTVNSSGIKVPAMAKTVPQNGPLATVVASGAGGSVPPAAQSQDQVLGQTKGKKKKKKRSALANASNPHHLKNYVPSRLPSSGTSGSAAPGTTGDYWGISPLPVRFLTSDIPPRKKGRGKKSTRQDKEKENQIPNAQVQTHPPEDEWICAFCEYDLFYGGQAGYNRAVKARKKVLKRRRRAKERAAGLGATKSKAPVATAPAEKFEPGDEDSGDEEQSGDDNVSAAEVGQQQQGNGVRAGRWKEEG